MWTKENIDFSTISHCGCICMCVCAFHPLWTHTNTHNFPPWMFCHSYIRQQTPTWKIFYQACVRVCVKKSYLKLQPNELLTLQYLAARERVNVRGNMRMRMCAMPIKFSFGSRYYSFHFISFVCWTTVAIVVVVVALAAWNFMFCCCFWLFGNFGKVAQKLSHQYKNTLSFSILLSCLFRTFSSVSGSICLSVCVPVLVSVCKQLENRTYDDKWE